MRAIRLLFYIPGIILLMVDIVTDVLLLWLTFSFLGQTQHITGFFFYILGLEILRELRS